MPRNKHNPLLPPSPKDIEARLATIEHYLSGPIKREILEARAEEQRNIKPIAGLKKSRERMQRQIKRLQARVTLLETEGEKNEA